jgi:hypothetical protein
VFLVSWRISDLASPAIRRWGDEVVVHHALSNDTYRLSSDAGRALIEIMQAGRAGTSGFFVVGAGDEPVHVYCLAALADLGLITRC